MHYFLPDDEFVTNFLDIILVIPYLLDAVVVGNSSVVCFTLHFKKIHAYSSHATPLTREYFLYCKHEPYMAVVRRDFMVLGPVVRNSFPAQLPTVFSSD